MERFDHKNTKYIYIIMIQNIITIKIYKIPKMWPIIKWKGLISVKLCLCETTQVQCLIPLIKNKQRRYNLKVSSKKRRQESVKRTQDRLRCSSALNACLLAVAIALHLQSVNVVLSFKTLFEKFHPILTKRNSQVQWRMLLVRQFCPG